MVRRLWPLIACGCALGMVLAPRHTAAQFTGGTADRAYFTDCNITEWGERNTEPRAVLQRPGPQPAQAKASLTPKNPIRWLLNEAPQPGTRPASWIEFFGGDCLPCRVAEFRYGNEVPLERETPHLLAEPLVEVDVLGVWDKRGGGPVSSPRKRLRVATQLVRRIIWQARSSDRYTPATVYCLDGRQIAFRALRWTSDGVLLLLRDETRRIPFSEIAELHLAHRDPWQAYYETLALICPDGEGRLMQVETTDGLVVTGSVAQCQVQSGNNGWYHGLHPAWSLDTVWVRHTKVEFRRWFAPHEVPLSRIEPRRAIQQSPLWGAWNWQADHNVLLKPLRNAGRAFGWGLGTLAYSELEFDLPPSARAFRSAVGLDEAVLRGGCARGLIYRDRIDTAPLWQSKNLIGSKETADSGTISLATGKTSPASLILVSHPATKDQPPGADPLNIRDLVDWLEPQLELDPAKLQAEVERLLPATIPAWQDWTVSTDPGTRLLVRRQPETPNADSGRLAAMVRGRLLLSRRLRLLPSQNYLCLAVSRGVRGAPPTWLEVRVDGKRVAEFEVPDAPYAGNAEPRMIPLKKYHDRTITIEVEHSATSDQAMIAWQALELVAQPEMVPWTRLEAVEARSSAGTELKVEEEQTIFAMSKDKRPPKFDTYTVVADARLPEITAFRLEALPDERLPKRTSALSWDGLFMLSDFKVTAAPLDKPERAEPVALASAEADAWLRGKPRGAAADGVLGGGWTPSAPERPHSIVFTTQQDVRFPAGTRLAFTLAHEAQPFHSIGRFRLSATGAARPVPVPRPVVVLPAASRWVLTIFEDQESFINQMNQGKGKARRETGDKYSGEASIAVVPPAKGHPRILNVGVKIRRNPAPGEYRYLRFAWKKIGGQAVCLQLAHDGQFGPTGGKSASYRYHAGPGPQSYGAAVVVDGKLPTEWTVVTRDLVDDFGEFTFTGLSLDAMDGTEALFDSILLGRLLQDLEPAEE